MRIPRIYLETTIFNFVFADDAPDKKQDALKLFGEIAAGKYEPYTSTYVTDEIDDALEYKRNLMYELISKYDIPILQATGEIQELARKYILEGIIPEKYGDDAYHIAAASVYEMDMIISYNFQHIVKLKTKVKTEAINHLLGYKKVEITTPTEVVDYD